jgi:hypothetical protein
MMNERIRQLAEQAVKAVDNPFPGNTLNDELAKMYIPDCFAEKFAELIVRECAGVADHSNVTGKSIIGQRIKEHFGVK